MIPQQKTVCTGGGGNRDRRSGTGRREAGSRRGRGRLAGYPAIMVKNSERETKRKGRSERNEGDDSEAHQSRVQETQNAYIHTNAPKQRANEKCQLYGFVSMA